MTGFVSRCAGIEILKGGGVLCFRFVVSFMVVLALATAAAAQHNQDSPANATGESAQGRVSDDGSGRYLVPERWWESASAIVRVSLRPRGNR